jgi:hypothetical protein
MSARTLPIRRTTISVVAVLATFVLGPSVAAADPPALNRDPCSVSLALAAHWPGGMETSTGTVRFVSDAYDRYLSAQPPCSSAVG